MGRKKKVRFQQNDESTNVVQAGKEIYNSIKGNWHPFFKNDNPITLEVGCGRGEYTVGLARVFSDQNFIGIDIKGSRLWKGSQLAQAENLNNVAFLRIQLANIQDFFNEREVRNIWITFPDPRPKDGDEKKRLTSPPFLEKYKSIIHPEGWVHLKTDSYFLFEYTLELLQQSESLIKDLIFTKDLYQSEILNEHHGIQTTYEKKFLAEGVPIKYLRFRFK